MKATFIKTTSTKDDEGGCTTRKIVAINGITLVLVSHPYGGCVNIYGMKGIVYSANNKVWHDRFSEDCDRVELDLPVNYLDMIKAAK